MKVYLRLQAAGRYVAAIAGGLARAVADLLGGAPQPRPVAVRIRVDDGRHVRDFRRRGPERRRQ